MGGSLVKTGHRTYLMDRSSALIRKRAAAGPAAKETLRGHKNPAAVAYDDGKEIKKESHWKIFVPWGTAR